jgi:hypothetical protein
MKIERYLFINPNYSLQKRPLAFKQSPLVQTLKYTNIGSLPDGFIGKIRVRTGDNAECFLNVIKKSLGDGEENYSINNENGNIVGEIFLKIKKIINYDRLQYPSDPSHVYVSDLINYSNPATPYYKNLEQYKDIGIRLMQIAQRRSDEAMCNGNIKLIAKNESKEWYKNVIGMTEEFSKISKNNYGFNIHNPNSMILPPDAKEKLSLLNGGL